MTSKKTLLIAGGGYADIPLIKSAQALGYYVITSGNNPNDLGHIESDKAIYADFSDQQAILKIAITEEISAICACANDFSAITCAYVADKLGLPGHDPYHITQLLHHKDSYREFALLNNIPSPKAKSFSNITSALSENEISYPLIVKPVDLTGGKGIEKISNSQELKQAVINAFDRSVIKRIVIEEFIIGSRHGFSSFIRDGKIVFHFSDNEHYYLNQYMVSAASTPTTAPDQAIKELIIQTEKIVSLLSLKTGIFHVQFILKDDKPIIIEICRRSPGDLYIKFVEHATGVNYAHWIVSAAAGLDCSRLTQNDTRGFYIRHCIMTNKTGILDRIVIDDSIKESIIDKSTWWKSGDRITNILTDKFGIVFLKFDTMSDMLNTVIKMNNLISVKLKD